MLKPLIESSYNLKSCTNSEKDNNRDSNMIELWTNKQENWNKKNSATNLVTNVIYYITEKLQINLFLKVSSTPQRESPRENDQIVWKLLKVGGVPGLSSTAFTLGSRKPCYSTVYTNFFFSHMSLNSVIHYFMHENSVSYSSIIFQHYFSLVSDKNNLSNWREIFWVFDRQIQRNQPEF